MEMVALIAANALVLLIVVIGMCVERRVTRLELERDMRREPDTGGGVSGAETRHDIDAERRFTEGVASILGYGLRAVGKEIEHVEDAEA